MRLGLQPAAPGSMVWLPTASPAPPRWQHMLPWLAPLAALVLIVSVLNAIWTPAESTAPSLLGKTRQRENALPVKAPIAAEATRSATGKNGTDPAVKIPRSGLTEADGRNRITQTTNNLSGRMAGCS